jgi:hypothetical protein
VNDKEAIKDLRAHLKRARFATRGGVPQTQLVFTRREHDLLIKALNTALEAAFAEAANERE